MLNDLKGGFMFDSCFLMQYIESFLAVQSSRISEVSRKLNPREIFEFTVLSRTLINQQ